MIRAILVYFAISILGAATLHAVDLTLIQSLPKRLTAARVKSEKGWDSGVNAQMRKASSDYTNAMKAMLVELAAAYYPEEHIIRQSLEEYTTALLAVARFRQNAQNVSGEPLGTNATLEVLDSVSTDLAAMISSMVQAITADEAKFDLQKWEKRWTEAQESTPQ
jgi:hypothetical protein